MNADINLMSGVEFEDLCKALLKKVGFDVETTKRRLLRKRQSEKRALTKAPSMVGMQ